MKVVIRSALGVVALGVMSLGAAAPAHAAKCYYVAYDMNKNHFVESAIALKMSNACDRARRQCNRQLERWRQQGRVARGSGCVRMSEAS